MADACVITRPSEDEPVFDEDTGEYTEGDPTDVFTGACFITPPRGVTEHEVGAGGKRMLVRLYRAKIPHDAPLPAPDDIFTVTASQYDPELVGRDLVVTNVDLSSVLVWRNLDLRYDVAL